MLQARGSEMARVLLIGIWKGTLAVTRRHMQSMPAPVRFLSWSQQSAVGEEPAAELFVRKFMQGVRPAMAVAEHGVVIWPLEGEIRKASASEAAMEMRSTREQGLKDAM
ncbi:unnamed protein product [Linum tenue]|uniref:Uncharacterized protein n=1 Tax=Linum tenue TaxID=586396 RepID=A0AAV0RQB1_9ROSI|nr:unnamed protein product [Linum tenue]